MKPPEKYRDNPDDFRDPVVVWAEYLSEKAFMGRVSKANKRAASTFKRSLRSAAGKWLRYYERDTGKSRFIIWDRPAAMYSNDGRRPMTGDEAFVQLQQLGVGELIWEKTCPHTDEATITEERERFPRGSLSYRVAITTCPRCKRKETVNLTDVGESILNALDKALAA